MFVAVPGERVDGHDFVGAAFSSGARVALVQKEVACPAGMAVIIVGDTIGALGAAARFELERTGAQVIGVTGSVGKTTTKNWVLAVLSGGRHTEATRGNQNTEIGLPLSILNTDPGFEVFVAEMGMRGRGQITYLTSIARPSVAVVTNIGDTHIELLGSRDEIINAKDEIVAGLHTGGTAVVNADDPGAQEILGRHPVRYVTYGMSQDADLRAESAEVTNAGIAYRLAGRLAPEGMRVSLPVLGQHQIYNSLAALAVGIVLGLGSEELSAGLRNYRPEPGRLAVVPGPYTIIDDTYNANPASVAAALKVLSGYPGRRRYAMLGDMLELGTFSGPAHAESGRLASQSADGLFFVGAYAAAAAEAAREARRGCVEYAGPNIEAAITAARRVLSSGDVILIKGSRGMRMERAVEELKGGVSR
jgi:UDP-N-acetylmuramoyl-tripeptide--D-alanyl-D-alanine ligase